MDPCVDSGWIEVAEPNGKTGSNPFGSPGINEPRRHWTAEEVSLVVSDYFSMFEDEIAGRSYSKAEHRSVLQKVLQRSNKSIEFKHCNISAVLSELGLPWIPGYQPLHHYQSLLVEEVERYLERLAEISDGSSIKPSHRNQTNYTEVFVAAPNRRHGEARSLERLIRKFDPAQRDERNRTLGRAGEEFVLEVEQRRLHAAGRIDLMRGVRWISSEMGDGAGYDILSFDPNTGSDKLIEVKTTRGGKTTPFFLSRNEEALSRERPASFHLYRVFEFGDKARIFALRPPLDEAVKLAVATWSASFR